MRVTIDIMRIVLETVLIAVAALNVFAVLKSIGGPPIEPCPVVLYEQKFQALKSKLGDDPVIGYLADNESYDELPNGQVDNMNLLSMRRFFCVQYVLTPKLLVHSTARHLVVGNFSSSEAARRAAQKNGLRIKEEWPNGACLLERASN